MSFRPLSVDLARTCDGISVESSGSRQWSGSRLLIRAVRHVDDQAGLVACVRDTVPDTGRDRATTVGRRSCSRNSLTQPKVGESHRASSYRTERRRTGDHGETIDGRGVCVPGRDAGDRESDDENLADTVRAGKPVVTVQLRDRPDQNQSGGLRPAVIRGDPIAPLRSRDSLAYARSFFTGGFVSPSPFTRTAARS